MIKYSVVIPTYNNIFMLNNTLESLNDQLDFDKDTYEVIVVDDGSSENTLAGIQATPRTYTFQYIYLERTSDSCRSRVRNIGWRKAQGQFVIFLDSDMIVNKNYLRELNQYFEHDEDMVVISFRYMLKDPVALEDVKSGKLFEKNYRRLDYFEARHFDSQVYSFNLPALKHPWHCVYSCNMALSKKNLETLNGFEERYKGWGMEDTDIGYRCYKRGLKIVAHLGMEALHQFHGEAFGTLKNPVKMVEWDINIMLMYKIFPKLNKELPRYRIYYAYFTRRTAQEIMRKDKHVTEHSFSLIHEEEIPELKERIIELSSKPGNLIIINDEVELPEFHLWVQLLGYTQSEIRYFPKSYMYSKSEIRQFMRGIFTWKQLFVISYRSTKLVGNKTVRFFNSLRLQPSKK